MESFLSTVIYSHPLMILHVCEVMRIDDYHSVFLFFLSLIQANQIRKAL